MVRDFLHLCWDARMSAAWTLHIGAITFTFTLCTLPSYCVSPHSKLTARLQVTLDTIVFHANGKQPCQGQFLAGITYIRPALAGQWTLKIRCLHHDCACRQGLPQPELSMAALAVEGMSLDRFMAKHTSEDNASFGQIMEESNKRRRLHKPWLFEQKDKVSAQNSFNDSASAERAALCSLHGAVRRDRAPHSAPSNPAPPSVLSMHPRTYITACPCTVMNSNAWC